MNLPTLARADVLSTAVALMGDTGWKNGHAPGHDHTLGSETGMTTLPDGVTRLTRLTNCPRCGEHAADRLWPLALDEAEVRILERGAQS